MPAKSKDKKTKDEEKEKVNPVVEEKEEKPVEKASDEPDKPEKERSPEETNKEEKDETPEKDIKEKAEKEEKEPEKEVGVPKITSFSQLDSESKGEKAEEKVGTKEEDKKTTPTTSYKVEEKPEVKEEEKTDLEKEIEKDEETKPEKIDAMGIKEEGTDEKKKEASSEEIKEWLNEVRPDTTKEMDKKGGPNLKLLFIIVLAIAVIGVVVGGVFYYQSGFSGQEVKEETTQEVTEESQDESKQEEVQQETVEIDLSAFSLNVLNGSGIAGEAGKVSGLLVEAGFSEAETGNASSYDHTTTTIAVKESVDESVYDSIKDALGGTYIVEKSEEALDSEGDYDIEITVGSKKAE